MNNDLISKSALVDKLQALEEGIFEEATQEMNPTKAIMAGIVEGAKKLVIDAPTIDAEPVVRCRDCKHRGNPDVCPWSHKELHFDAEGVPFWKITDGTICGGFCHLGTKADGGAAHA